MEEAIVLGSIRMKLVGREERKRAFSDLMCDCFADMVEDVAGVRPTFPDGPQEAPEHERAGTA